MSTDTVDSTGNPPEVPGPFGAPVPAEEAGPTLRADNLNLFDSTVVAVSSVAPAYTLAATMAALFLTAGIGYAGPAVIWLAFVPVLFIAISYFHLNRRDPSAGASYSWLSKLVSPDVGWFNGWVQVALSVLFCISAPILAGQYTLQLLNQWNWISSSTANSVGTAAVVAGIWLAVITFICIWGIRWTTNFQWVLLIVEYVAVIGFSIWGIVKVAVSHPAGSRPFSIGWLNPFHIQSIGALSAGIVLGVFFYWGWDVTANLNEETKDASKTSGQGGLLGTICVFLLFEVFTVATNLVLTPAQLTNSNNAADILAILGQAVWHGTGGKLIVLAVLLSVVMMFFFYFSFYCGLQAVGGRAPLGDVLAAMPVGADTVGIWGPGFSKSGVDPEWMASMIQKVVATVTAAETHAGFHCFEQVVELHLSNGAHSPYRHDQAQSLHVLTVQQRVQRVGDGHVKAALLQILGKDLGYLARLVPFPTAPDN